MMFHPIRIMRLLKMWHSHHLLVHRLHDDYHRPSDDSPGVNSKAGAEIASLAGELVLTLAEIPRRPVYTDVDAEEPSTAAESEGDPHAEPTEAQPTQGGYSVWFGSQPDMTYTQDDGLRLTGTVARSPAEKCGLLGGDIIVSLDGQAVRNLQDYAVLLFSHKPGDIISLVVRRGDETLEIQATLGGQRRRQLGMVKLRATIQVPVGDLMIGSEHPVRVQSMTNTLSTDREGTAAQIKRMVEAGCELVRVTIPDAESAANIPFWRSKMDVPFIADIHFNHKMALAAIEQAPTRSASTRATSERSPRSARCFRLRTPRGPRFASV